MSSPESLFFPVVPLGLLLILALSGRPVANGDMKDTAKNHSSSGSSSVGSRISACLSCGSVIVEAFG